MAQLPRTPDLEAQRAAMEKLGFLVGEWTGEARLWRGPGKGLVLAQTEEAQYKLGGLILVIEGTGRTEPGGKLALQAFGVISYDDDARKYYLRAFNDGRFLETAIKLSDHGNAFTWGFVWGEVRTSSALRLNEKGEWTELHEITVGSQPSRNLMEIIVRRQEL